MSTTRINSKQLDSYGGMAKKFFPKELSSGHCYGHAHLGKNAALIDYENFESQNDFMLYGVFKNNKSSERISLNDLNNLIKELNLESYIETVEKKEKSTKTLNKEKIIKNTQETENKESNDNKQEADEISKAFNELVKTLDFTDIIDVSEQKEDVEIKEHRGKPKKVAPNELKEQISLAWKIRTAFIAKTRESILNEAKEAKTEMSEQALRKKLRKSIKQFDKNYSFIWELIQLNIYLENLVLIQATGKFPQLFEERDQSSHQGIERVKHLIMPVAFDSKQEKNRFNDECLDTISTMHTLDSLNLWLKSLTNVLNKGVKQSMHGDLQPVLPFVLTLTTLDHTIAVAYCYATQEWILINSNKGLKKLDIAEEIFKAFILQYYIHSGKHTLVKLGYISSKHEFVLNESRKINAPNNSVDDEKIALALLKSSKVRRIQELKLNIAMEIYTTHQAKNWIAPLVSTWKNSPEFRKGYKTTLEEKDRLDDIFQQSLLHFVCTWGDVNKARELIKLGTNINHISTTTDTTPLMRAGIENQVDIFKALMDAQTDIFTENKWGESAISVISKLNPNAELFSLLIAKGANPNHILNDGESCLMQAARTGNVNAIEKLIEHKADVNYIDSKRGLTALYFAVYFGHPMTTKIFLDHGATFEAAGKNNRTFFNDLELKKLNCEKFYQRAFSNGAFLIFIVLHSKNFALEHNRSILLDILIEAKANLNDALMLVCLHGTAESAKKLLEKKADINYQSHLFPRGKARTTTPLLLAKQYQLHNASLIETLATATASQPSSSVSEEDNEPPAKRTRLNSGKSNPSSLFTPKPSGPSDSKKQKSYKRPRDR